MWGNSSPGVNSSPSLPSITHSRTHTDSHTHTHTHTDTRTNHIILRASLSSLKIRRGLSLNYSCVTTTTAAPHLVAPSPNANPLNHSLPWCVFLQRTFLPGQNYISCRLTCGLSTASVFEEWRGGWVLRGGSGGGAPLTQTNTNQNEWQSWGTGGYSQQ